MNQSNERLCQWRLGCTNRASKHVTYNRQTGETEFDGTAGTFRRGLSPEYFWCAIYERVCDHVGQDFFSAPGETLDIDHCQYHLKGLVERRWSEPFNKDVLAIASKYINEVVARVTDYVD